jgi:uncharacterized protein YjbI with pentapeptide repeats
MGAGKEDIIHNNKKFEQINYEGKSLSNRVFSKCIFIKCSLKECFFDDSVFEDCIFEDSDISLLKFKDTAFKNISLRNTKAVGIMWTEAETPFSINASNSRLSYSSFYGKKMKKARLTNCIADEADFTECDLTQAVFTGTDFRGATFSNTILTKADFVGALNYAIDTRTNKLTGAKFALPEALSFLYGLGIELIDPIA